MPNSHLHPPSVVPKISRFGRVLAGIQVLKETLSVIFLAPALIMAAPLVVLAALPGVALYVLHWQLALGRVGRVFAAVVWGLTLLDELWGLLLFKELSSGRKLQMLHGSYFLGLGIILLALAEPAWRWQHRRLKSRRNVHHQAMLKLGNRS